MMTISMQSTFPTVYESFPVGSVHSNIGTCPLFLDLVIYLMSDLLIIKKKSFSLFFLSCSIFLSDLLIIQLMLPFCTKLKVLFVLQFELSLTPS